MAAKCLACSSYQQRLLSESERDCTDTQRRLSRRGRMPGKVDGHLGPLVPARLALMQASDRATWRKQLKGAVHCSPYSSPARVSYSTWLLSQDPHGLCEHLPSHRVSHRHGCDNHRRSSKPPPHRRPRTATPSGPINRVSGGIIL